ncbi:MAG TPA: hypothetical protein DEA96_16875 [Leptospiraceae bacterium]|nr:hypothetical protein [Spirochaetaceae bacterium]HBS06646.1 hypothetical protein [Leptospiraceae bacterium]
MPESTEPWPRGEQAWFFAHQKLRRTPGASSHLLTSACQRREEEKYRPSKSRFRASPGETEP